MSEPATDLQSECLPPVSEPPPTTAELAPPPLTPARRALALRPVPRSDAIPAKRCPTGHANDPEASECGRCDRPFDPAAAVVDLVPRVLARLLLEDGTAIDLVADVLIGRCPPEDDPAETVSVPGRQVSRVHFAIEVNGWRLLICDRRSTNGTFLTRRGERGRRRVPEERAIPLRIGDTVHFGGRQAMVAEPLPPTEKTEVLDADHL